MTRLAVHPATVPHFCLLVEQLHYQVSIGSMSNRFSVLSNLREIFLFGLLL